MNPTDLAADTGAIAAFAIVGIALMGLGYWVVDLLTPGRLADLIWTERNHNAAVVLGANTASVGIIVFTAIRASQDAFVAGLVSAAVYGVIGVALMALCFVLVDALTPGKLGDIVVSAERHPAAWVTATAHVSVALIVASAIL